MKSPEEIEQELSQPCVTCCGKKIEPGFGDVWCWSCGGSGRESTVQSDDKGILHYEDVLRSYVPPWKYR